MPDQRTSLKIFLGPLPAAARGRRVLRDLGTHLYTLFRRTTEPDPLYILVGFRPEGDPAPIVDLLLLAPEGLLVGLIKPLDHPVDIQPDGHWLTADGPIQGPHGETPLAQIRVARALVTRQIARQADAVPGFTADEHLQNRAVGALIAAPRFPPESRATLSIEDHRAQIKVLGLDELPGLATMLRSGTRLTEPAMQSILVEIFDGQLWHDGRRQLFEPAAAPFYLRVLRDEGERVIPLLEGINVIGRRRTPLQHEHRLTISGDDLMSNDHCIIVCNEAAPPLLRDTSTNGTWLRRADGSELKIHRSEHVLPPGNQIRLGATHVRLERLETTD